MGGCYGVCFDSYIMPEMATRIIPSGLQTANNSPHVTSFARGSLE
jgi:hypothetical protein